MAAKLGSDVPVCLNPSPARMQGRGEHVYPYFITIHENPKDPVPSIHAVIFNPGIALETKKVFAEFAKQNPNLPLIDNKIDRNPPNPASIQSFDELIELAAWENNDLADAACAVSPGLSAARDVIESQSEAKTYFMSGSGASLVALCESESDAKNLAQRLRAFYPKAWAENSRLIPS